jgi:hypothetical protein
MTVNSFLQKIKLFFAFLKVGLLQPPRGVAAHPR